jgi:CheY-like chemotaxis protein
MTDMPDGADALKSTPGEKRVARASIDRDCGSQTAKVTPVVLLVDDDRLSLRSTAATLCDLGCTTLLAGNAEKALQILENQSSVDVVVTDLNMPQVDGLELLCRIKQSAQYKDLPVILCSGHDDPETMQNAAENGCALYLLKPFEPEFLFEQISTVLMP